MAYHLCKFFDRYFNNLGQAQLCVTCPTLMADRFSLRVTGKMRVVRVFALGLVALLAPAESAPIIDR